MNDRVKYYPSNDLCFGHNLYKIETMEIPSFDEIDINDAIEFFQINKYFKEGARNKYWSDKEYEQYRSKSEELGTLTKRFINNIDDDNIINIYNSIDIGYHSEFWFLFDNCKLYNKISVDVFESLIKCDRVSLHDLFFYKYVVWKYGNSLREFILNNDYCIGILLHVYEQDYMQDDKLTLPTELTGEDICGYIERYIEMDNVNANYLNIIIDMHYTKQFPITDEIRLKAKKRYEFELENIANTGATITHGFQLSLDPTQDEVKIVKNNGLKYSVSYSTKWLLDTLDYPSILNNFIYVFEFVDCLQMRCNHVNKISQSGIFERTLASKSSRVYPHNFAFGFLNKIASAQMQIYYEFLVKQGIHLEDVIKWFFTEEIQSEFGCSEIRLLMPTPSSSYAEKCSTIIAAFESVLKQYSLYVKNGNIDFELIGMSTTPILFENIKSLVPDKYVYGVGEDYKQLSFWLFSDQCTFSYIERLYKLGHKYDCFADLLFNEQIYLSDYRKEEQSAFKRLEKFGLISLEDDGHMLPKDKNKLTILRDLFQNDVVSKNHYPPTFNGAFRDFAEKGVIETRANLFSQPEIDYLNYLLNRKEYSNGLEIRNRYIHGIKQVNTNEKEHMEDYFVLLRLFVILAIKINDDLCLNDEKSCQ